MNDSKVFIDELGTEWRRLFTNIQFPSVLYKKFNEKDLSQGGKYKVHHITQEMAQAQGCKDADEYIEVNNELIKEHKKKAPSAKKKFIK